MLREINSFLSSTTIHGLSYIPSSRKPLKLFWLSVVLAGFTCSICLIQKSFRGWQESPISTSVEILPITEITFPNVTVCPPRKTFTALNVDLGLAREITVNVSSRDQLLGLVRPSDNDSWSQFYSDLFEDHTLDTILITLSGIIHQQRELLESCQKKEKGDTEDLERTQRLFQEVLTMFQLRSLEANMMSLSHSDLSREDGYLITDLQLYLE